MNGIVNQSQERMRRKKNNEKPITEPEPSEENNKNEMRQICVSLCQSNMRSSVPGISSTEAQKTDRKSKFVTIGLMPARQCVPISQGR